MAGKLTPKQALFVQEYLVDLNATQAAIRAGYSKKTAYSMGQENLNKPEIQAAITEAKAKRIEAVQIDANRVILELAHLGLVDISQAVEFGPHGVTVKDSKELPEGVRRAISEVSQVETANGKTVKVKFHDKVPALKLLGEHLGLFDDKAPPPPPATVNVHLNLQDLVREEVRLAVATIPKTLEEVNAANPVPPPPDGFKVREDP